MLITPEEVVFEPFATSRHGRRYDLDIVDDMLDTVVGAMRTGRCPVHVRLPMKQAGFLAEGYDYNQVNRFLKRLRAQGTITY